MTTEDPSPVVPRRTLLPASLICVAGITFSGAAFGTLLFPVIGTLLGFVLALFTSVPICLILMNITRLMHGPAIRKSTIVGLAALCGSLSGLASVLLLGGLKLEALPTGAVASCFGAPGGAFSVWLWLRREI